MFRQAAWDECGDPIQGREGDITRYRIDIKAPRNGGWTGLDDAPAGCVEAVREHQLHITDREWHVSPVEVQCLVVGDRMTIGDLQHPVEDACRRHGPELGRGRDGEKRHGRVKHVDQHHVDGVSRLAPGRCRDQLLHRKVGPVQNPPESRILHHGEETVAVRFVPLDLRGVAPVAHQRFDAEAVEAVVDVDLEPGTT